MPAAGPFFEQSVVDLPGGDLLASMWGGFENDRTPTGYAQVLEENDGTTAKTYTLGHDVITQADDSSNIYHFLHDGHGSTRALLDTDGDIVSGQAFYFDAFGNPIGFDPANALTSLLYSGEQTDPTGLQYLRARYYDPASGRFNRLDPFAGNMSDPQSLHKYLYAHADPINGIDPSGEFFNFLYGFTAEMKLQAQRAAASLQALRGAYGLQRLVSIYQTTISAYAQIGFRAAEFLVRSGPTIQKITTLSGIAFVTSTVRLVCEEAGFVARTGYTEFVVAASSTLFSGGFTFSQASNQLRGIIEPLRGTKDGRLLSGRIINSESLGRNPKWTNNPYRSYTFAAEGRLKPGTKLIRFYTRDVTGRMGSFTTFVEDAQGLSYAQIQRKFALPFLPNRHVFANGSGMKAVVGLAGRNFGMQGYGRQVELLQKGRFVDPL